MIYRVDRLGIRRKPEVCAVCGKRFERSPEHVYKQACGKRVLYACSWTCRKKQMESEQKSKPAAEEWEPEEPELSEVEKEEKRVKECLEKIEMFAAKRARATTRIDKENAKNGVRRWKKLLKEAEARLEELKMEAKI